MKNYGEIKQKNRTVYRIQMYVQGKRVSQVFRSEDACVACVRHLRKMRAEGKSLHECRSYAKVASLMDRSIRYDGLSWTCTIIGFQIRTFSWERCRDVMLWVEKHRKTKKRREIRRHINLMLADEPAVDVRGEVLKRLRWDKPTQTLTVKLSSDMVGEKSLELYELIKLYINDCIA